MNDNRSTTGYSTKDGMMVNRLAKTIIEEESFDACSNLHSGPSAENLPASPSSLPNPDDPFGAFGNRSNLERPDLSSAKSKRKRSQDEDHVLGSNHSLLVDIRGKPRLINGMTGILQPVKASESVANGETEFTPRKNQDTVLKLPAEKLLQLTLTPDSAYSPTSTPSESAQIMNEEPRLNIQSIATDLKAYQSPPLLSSAPMNGFTNTPSGPGIDRRRPRNLTIDVNEKTTQDTTTLNARPYGPQRALSTPASVKSPLSPRNADKSRSTSLAIGDSAKGENGRLKNNSGSTRPLPSPMPSSIPLPPLSLPTYLQLELSSQRPSKLYIHRSANNDFPYESSRAKIERLQNFLLLPLHLESVLWFGTLACLDSWLYTFTILPLRLLKSVYILSQSWVVNILAEAQFVFSFVYNGTGRVLQRQRDRKNSIPTRKLSTLSTPTPKTIPEIPSRSRQKLKRHHQRQKSVPSTLLPDDKADILKGLLIICTCLILLRFDASRMYHWIRGQAAIKLYVIYNVLEVCDRLFSAIGQDVLECLFSRETLERKPDGHSKVLRPFWLFILALIYTVIHSTALFYQVITLNVAVNSYSNALITLLISNQFVEIKSTVFKKFEKENLFQLTCADVVERFQLWHMLVIIASRNIVETGGFGQNFGSSSTSRSTTPPSGNQSMPLTQAIPPLTMSSILPRSFTLVPSMVNSISAYVPTIGTVFGPFFVVLGSEMLVDWIKHAYINKFNNTRPAIYGRFLDVLAKDYYTNAFEDQNLTKRLGLPVIPLSCLLIRASVQTYQMLMAAWLPSTPASFSTSLAMIHEDYTATRSSVPATTSGLILKTIDDWLSNMPSSVASSRIATHFTTIVISLLVFLVLLACKLVLGMLLLAFARSRYRSMKEREKNPIQTVEGGRRVGGWGVVEVDEDKQRWVYDDDPAGLRVLREREEREKLKREKERERGVTTDTFDQVKRYEMLAKRIW